MTLSNLTVKERFAGDGATTDFTIPHDFQDNTEIVVFIRDESVTPAVETLQVLTTDYTLIGGPPVTQVRFNTEPAATDIVLITRVTPNTQATDYLQNDPFPSNSHETALDKLTQRVQEIAEKLTRTPRLRVTSAFTDTPLPQPVGDNMLAWNTAATAIENKSADDILNLTGALAIANNLSDVASAATSRINLGVEIGVDVQAFNTQLLDIAGLARTDSNFIVGNGSTWVAETGATARASMGVTIGSDVQAFDADLAALAALTGTGILARTAADTYVERTITGTADEIVITNGDGVSGNPVIGIADNPIFTGTGSITVPTGTTAQRPGAPVNGMIRYNSDTNQIEGFSNSSWIALVPTTANLTFTTIDNGDSPYSALTSDEIILVDATAGAVTINLFAASGNTGKRLMIKKTDATANAVTIDGSTTETLDGELTKVIDAQFDVADIVTDGSNWHRMDVSHPFIDITLMDGNGGGSSETQFRRYSVVLNNSGGAFMTLTDSATLGADITVNVGGLYACKMSDANTASGETVIRITRNIDQAGDDNAATEIADAETLARGSSNDAGSNISTANWTGYLQPGDVIRPNTNGSSANTTDNRAHFQVTRLGP